MNIRGESSTLIPESCDMWVGNVMIPLYMHRNSWVGKPSCWTEGIWTIDYGDKEETISIPQKRLKVRNWPAKSSRTMDHFIEWVNPEGQQWTTSEVPLKILWKNKMEQRDLGLASWNLEFLFYLGNFNFPFMSKTDRYHISHPKKGTTR